MPAMIGGFGKIVIISFSKTIITFFHTISSETNSSEMTLLRSKWGPYLAGLIEADGSIAVHDPKSNSKRYRPKILIVFAACDKPLADKLASLLGIGIVYFKTNAGYAIWHIQKTEDVMKIINIINGFMRTPKIEALHRAINWFHLNDHSSMECLGLDCSPINSNAWLAGFTDGDGNFSINLVNRKKKGIVTTKRVQTFFRIEVRQNYHRSSPLVGTSYFDVLSKIALYLNVNVISRTREQGEKIFYAFTVISHNKQSHLKVIEYFDLFPLYSSKYLAYKDWSSLVKKNIDRDGKPLSQEDIIEIERMKSQFNSKRKIFDFSHLDDIT